MKTKQYNEELLYTQKKLRNKLLHIFSDFNISKAGDILAEEDGILTSLDQLVENSQGSRDESFFSVYKYLLVSILHLLKFVKKELEGELNNHLNASKNHISLIDIEALGYLKDFKKNIHVLTQEISSVKDIKDVNVVISRFVRIPFPMVSEFPIQQSYLNKDLYEQEPKSNEEKKIVLSLSLYIDGEPWPNPKILKPEINYKISGTIYFNYWPEGYKSLIIKPVSTTSNEWFILSLPIIEYQENVLNYEISGSIVFKYPQNSIDDNISLRLLAYFEKSTEKLFPILIGYDQLILKVLDPNSNQFLTGFNMMNKAVFEISKSISLDLPNIEKTEKENFLFLLSGILNYQAFSIQQGIYKNISSKSEDIFRDDLIRHLIGLPYLGEQIIKESHLSGGRVEISFKGIIAELKVETKISNRKKMIEKYMNQPIAYSSGNIKQLSILCILDLTEKKNPPANPLNNISLISPPVHGFEDSELAYPSKVAVIIIDGNIKKPSDYSK
ncbi:hypothetical protein [Chryseobacterium gambrini]|uniref:hypothetical protein n=1 Tax=Chryseobacterium gambrini TaxID=373672 RepID=UPI0022F3BC51|nr:hypothetical protein [Chryseobacterium gambrini]WBX99466.1 hypothetical protein PE065_09480 [Chryseobacterium gambrini]